VLGRLEVEAAGEGGQAPQRGAGGGLEQVVAPVEQPVEGPLAVRERRVAALDDRGRPAKARHDLPGGQDAGARGGQLDRERQAVELGAQLRDGVAVVRGGEGGAVEEEPHRRGVARARRKRFEPVHAFGPQPERDAAGRQDAHAGTALQQLGDRGADGLDQVLAVVEDHERMALAEVLAHVRPHLAARHRPRADRVGDGRRDDLGRHERGEVDEPCAVAPGS
jgi:hypothetical protein